MPGAEQYECKKITPRYILLELEDCKYKDPKYPKEKKKSKTCKGLKINETSHFSPVTPDTTSQWRNAFKHLEDIIFQLEFCTQRYHRAT